MFGPQFNVTRAFSYARVSTKHQSGLSIEGQLQVCRRFAEMLGIEIVREFSDKESGSTLVREQFDEMLELAKSGTVDGILCEKYDRFSRSGASGEVLIQEIERKHPLKVIAAAEVIDTSTPLGKAMRGVKMIFSALEREEIVDRTTRRMRDIASHGYWMGGQPPLGYKVASEVSSDGKTRKKLVIDEKTAPLVKEIFRMYADGKSQREIVDWLNDNGYQTARGNKFSKNSLSDLLRNEKYVGTYTYSIGSKKTKHQHRDDAVKIPGALPPIISNETWKAVKTRFIAHSGYVHKYHLAGILFCGECGNAMHGHGGKQPDYRCTNHKPGVSVTKKKVEMFALGYVEHELLVDMTDADFEIMAEAVNRRASEVKNLNQDKIDSLNMRLLQLEKEEKLLTDAIREGIPLENIKDQAQQIAQEKSSLRGKLQELKTAAKRDYVSPEELRNNWIQIKQEFFAGSAETRERILRSLIRKVTVYKDYIQVVPK